ncbi:MAG: hypothetical protein HQ582_05175, partial [Planctomycetes bacterium]|nr:hypothetical protein [Planctomycetota bacterium]
AEIRGLVKLLEAHAPAKAEELDSSLSQRLSVWEQVFELKSPFEGWETVFDARLVKAADERLVSRFPPDVLGSPLVRTNVTVTGSVQMEAVFDESWRAAAVVGLALASGDSPKGDADCAFTVAPAEAAATTPRETVSESGEPSRLLRTLAGHSDTVWTVRFSPDGSLIASGDRAGTIRLCEAETGKELALFDGSQPVHSIFFTPDGGTLLAANHGKDLRRIDVETGAEEDVALPESSRYAALSADGGPLAYVRFNARNRIVLWDIQQKAVLRELSDHGKDVRSLAFFPDGSRLASGSLDGAVIVWDLSTSEERLRLDYGGPVQCVAVSPDGRTVAAVGSGAQCVALWDAASGDEIGRIATVVDNNQVLAFSPDGRTLASQFDWRVIRLWDVATRMPVATLDACPRGLQSLAFSPDGNSLAAALVDGTIQLWDANRAVVSAPQAREIASPPAYQLSILRSGVAFRETTVKADAITDGPLRIVATCDGGRLALQVNDLAPVQFHDLFSLGVAEGTHVALYWPPDVKLDRLRASTQTLAEVASHVQKGDQAFASGRYEEAMASYRAQTRASAGTEAGQESRFKAAICLSSLGREDEAAAEFEQLAAERGDRWPMLAACQLWLYRAKRGELDKAELIFQSISGHVKFKQLAALIPVELIRELLDAYRNRYEYTGGMGNTLRHNPMLVQDLERLVTLESFLGKPRARKRLLRACRMEGDQERAIEIGWEILEDGGPAAHYGDVEEYCWMLRLVGRLDEALRVINGYLFDDQQEGAYNAQNVRLLVDRSKIFAKMGNQSAVRQDLEEILRLLPGDQLDLNHMTDARLMLGFLHEDEGDHDGAQRIWQTGLAPAEEICRKKNESHGTLG